MDHLVSLLISEELIGRALMDILWNGEVEIKHQTLTVYSFGL